MKFELSAEKISLWQARAAAVDFLKLSGVENAGIDVDMLLENAAGIAKSRMFLERDRILDHDTAKRFCEMAERRAQRIPVQQILNEAWFYGRCFYVDENVLVPRMDTEVLVEETLKYLEDKMKVLDMCTGSGCIILTLAKEKDIQAAGADISKKALDIARINSERLDVRCRFIQSDLFENINEKFDIIVSNPPYIKTQDIEELQPEVKDHEPAIALDGGTDGIDFYRKITKEAERCLESGGRLIFEIGYDESIEVSKILSEYGFKEINIIKDLSGLPRVISARNS